MAPACSAVEELPKSTDGMGMRDIVSSLLATQPARGFVVRLARSHQGRRFLNNLFPRRGMYDSFQDAWKAAGKSRYAGHEHLEAVELHARLADDLLPSDYPVLYWLSAIAGDIRLFDYGGNVGNVYYRYARYIDASRRAVHWTVYDLPKVIDMAKGIAVQRGGSAPLFTTSLLDSANSNVLLVSGAYHFWEGSNQEFLEQFPRLPEHIFVNRSPFYNDQAPIISIGSESRYAAAFIIRNAMTFLGDFSRMGYELIDQWKAAEHRHDMPFFPDQSVASYSGFYFRLESV